MSKFRKGTRCERTYYIHHHMAVYKHTTRGNPIENKYNCVHLQLSAATARDTRQKQRITIFNSV